MAKGKGTENSAEATLVKKVSAKVVMGGEVKRPDKATALYTLYGIVDGIKVGQSNYGEFTGFTGQFMAVRAEDSAQFAGPVAFLPEPAQGMTLALLRQAQEVDPTATVRIAFKIGVKPSKVAAVGYEYTVKPLVQAKHDALADLRAEIAGYLAAAE